MEGEIEARFREIEGGMAGMRIENASNNSITTQLKDTLKELSASLKSFGETNLQMQVTMNSLQKEIERGNKFQEVTSRKIDDLARFSADMESMRGTVNLLDQREKNDVAIINGKITTLETKVDEKIDEFDLHKEDSKIDIVKSIRNGSSWLLNIVLALALVWALFGQNVRLP